jgi:hypothetical protein
LSGAALGFSVSLLSEQRHYIGFVQSMVFHADLVFHMLSMGAGVWFAINRVRDFDLTAKVAREREIDPKKPTLKQMRSTLRAWGRLTRRLYRAQAVCFGIGAVFFVLAGLMRYAEVLYRK